MSETFYMAKGERLKVLAKIAAFLSSLPVTRAWRIEVTEAKSQRSIQQCRYLNGIAYKRISDATGYERDDVSEYLCMRYFGERMKQVPKTKWNPEGIAHVPIRTTTTDELGKRSVLTTTEFSDFVAFVQRFGAHHGIHIPDPDEEFQEEARAA